MPKSRLNKLFLEETRGKYLTPIVSFDNLTGICKIEGESYLSDAVSFYTILVEWLNTFLEENPNKELILDIKLYYFSTSSSLGLLEIFRLLKKYYDKGSKITVNWHYEEENGYSLEEAEDYMEYTNLPINLIAY